MRRPVIARRVRAAGEELNGVVSAFQRLMAVAPDSDEALFEKVEKGKALEEQHTAATAQCKEVAGLALDCDLVADSDELEQLLAEARKVKMQSSEQLLQWRKTAGVWSEKNRRPVRADLSLPTYAAGLSGKVTVYEFERDWREYSKAMEFSREEALKSLKQAVLPLKRMSVKSDSAQFTMCCSSLQQGRCT